MDIATIVGLLVGFLSIIVASAAGGGIKGFLDPMSAVLVLGGAISATLVHYPLENVRNALRRGTQVFRSHKTAPQALADMMVEMATKSRRQGILSLESDLEAIPPGLLHTAVGKAIDGSTPEQLREALENELQIVVERNAQSEAVFESLGAYSPAFGMIGTLVGLVKMCSTLDDPKTLGPALALALVTTFYGALLANLVFLPIAGKLQIISDQEYMIGAMIIQGMTAISSGANPRSVEEMLSMYLQKREVNTVMTMATESPQEQEDVLVGVD